LNTGSGAADSPRLNQRSPDVFRLSAIDMDDLVGWVIVRTCKAGETLQAEPVRFPECGTAAG
jgi:hypothetical protein